MIALKIVKWIIAWKKIDFADLVKDAKSGAGFSSSRTEWRHINTAKLPRQFKTVASEVASFEANFFRIAGTSEAETSVSGKAECSLAIGEDKKTKLFGVTFTFQ